MNAKVDAFLKREKRWQAEMKKMRAIALGCELTEELKWGQPCYTYQDKNIVLIHGFKEYCAFLFFQGALLKDTKGILVQQTANVQAARQVRFTSLSEITAKEKILKAYIREAVGNEKAGLKVTFKKTAAFDMPEEFQNALNSDSALEEAFYSLTPGRQRAYLLHFSSAKQPKTREARVAKYVPQILKGRGLDD